MHGCFKWVVASLRGWGKLYFYMYFILLYNFYRSLTIRLHKMYLMFYKSFPCVCVCVCVYDRHSIMCSFEIKRKQTDRPNRSAPREMYKEYNFYIHNELYIFCMAICVYFYVCVCILCVCECEWKTKIIYFD